MRRLPLEDRPLLGLRSPDICKHVRLYAVSAARVRVGNERDDVALATPHDLRTSQVERVDSRHDSRLVRPLENENDPSVLDGKHPPEALGGRTGLYEGVADPRDPNRTGPLQWDPHALLGVRATAGDDALLEGPDGTRVHGLHEHDDRPGIAAHHLDLAEPERLQRMRDGARTGAAKHEQRTP